MKIGCASAAFCYYKSKKANNDVIDNLAFVIVYDNYKHSLELLAYTGKERERWINVLTYFIEKRKKNLVKETIKK